MVKRALNPCVKARRFMSRGTPRSRWMTSCGTSGSSSSHRCCPRTQSDHLLGTRRNAQQRSDLRKEACTLWRRSALRASCALWARGWLAHPRTTASRWKYTWPRPLSYPLPVWSHGHQNAWPWRFPARRGSASAASPSHRCPRASWTPGPDSPEPKRTWCSRTSHPWTPGPCGEGSSSACWRLWLESEDHRWCWSAWRSPDSSRARPRTSRVSCRSGRSGGTGRSALDTRVRTWLFSCLLGTRVSPRVADHHQSPVRSPSAPRPWSPSFHWQNVSSSRITPEAHIWAVIYWWFV